MSQAAALRRVAWFIGVGGAAAGVHLGLVVLLVERAGWPPLLANVAGWVVAAAVSFAGHHRFTFGGHGALFRGAASRFAVVSAAGFVVNEAAYALLLGATGLRFDAALAVVLLGVACVTYLLGRHWVFVRTPRRR